MKPHRYRFRLWLAAIASCVAASGAAFSQEVKGSLTANGKTAELRYAIAQEVDSKTEKGYMDVIVVLSDRKLSASDARDTERLEAMARKDGLVALVVKLNPDARVMSAEPLHPAFTAFISSGVFVRWKPSAYDEKRVAGRFWTEGVQKELKQEWSYDLTFSAPITLDPEARTVPRK
jgi:hypothetical protein